MNIYIDESGSMTKEVNEWKNKFFVITLLLTDKPDMLKRAYKRFVSKHYTDLQSMDTSNKMFDQGSFKELKGYCFTPQMKRKFVYFFCQKNNFRLLFIRVSNLKASDNLFRNKARAFNYILKLAFEYLHNQKILSDREWNIQIDERNVKKDAKYQLQDFLLTELSTGKNIVDNISVQYYDSCNNKLVQLADVFSNIFYSNILTCGAFSKEIRYIINAGI